MSVNYQEERGFIGTWKNRDIYVAETKEWLALNKKNDENIYVIADDDMRMVLNNMVIGYLSPGGNVTQIRERVWYKPKKVVEKSYKAYEEKKKEEEPSAEEVNYGDLNFDEIFASAFSFTVGATEADMVLADVYK